MEPDEEIRNQKANAVDDGKPLALSTENGGRRIWYWYWADLAPGKHSVEFTIPPQRQDMFRPGCLRGEP